MNNEINFDEILQNVKYSKTRLDRLEQNINSENIDLEELTWHLQRIKAMTEKSLLEINK